MRTKEYENLCLFFLKVLGFGGKENSIFFQFLAREKID